MKLTGITAPALVKGIGTIRLLVYTDHGSRRYIETEAYYVPDANIRLLSVYKYTQQERNGTEFKIDEHGCSFRFSSKSGGGRITFDMNSQRNLPITTVVNQQKKNNDSTNQIFSVVRSGNINLTRPQKELLKIHFRLGHWNLAWIQTLIRKGIVKTRDARTHKVEAQCQCAACNFAKQTKKPEGTVKQTIRKDKDGNLKKNQLRVGGLVSTDQYVSSVPGRLPHTFGKEKSHEKYSGGTIFVDEASGLMYVQNQVSLGAAETIRAKHDFEREASRFGVSILGYRGDNGVYKSKAFTDDLERFKQTIQFCGVGGHHHNGITERAIRTVSTCARTMMIHAIIHNHKEVTTDLWPFAVDYAVYLWNKMPRKDGGLSPEEIFYSVKSDYEAIREAKCWGCPAYVLDPKLQDGKKLPRWNPRSRLGQFLGRSKKHAGSVGLIRNLNTGAISPQFHVVYDNDFTTVDSVTNLDNIAVPEGFDSLLTHSSENQIDPHDIEKVPKSKKERVVVPEGDNNRAEIDQHKVDQDRVNDSDSQEEKIVVKKEEEEFEENVPPNAEPSTKSATEFTDNPPDFNEELSSDEESVQETSEPERISRYPVRSSRNPNPIYFGQEYVNYLMDSGDLDCHETYLLSFDLQGKSDVMTAHMI